MTAERQFSPVGVVAARTFIAHVLEPIPAQRPPTLPEFLAVSHSDATGMFINETHTSAAIWQYRVEKMILEGKTKYQTYQIATVPRFGKSLFLDYNIQTSLMDEYIFHECMSQPAMTLHPNPKKASNTPTRQFAKHSPTRLATASRWLRSSNPG